MVSIQGYARPAPPSFNWRIPAGIRHANPRDDPNQVPYTGVLLTPAAQRHSAMTAPLTPEFRIRTDPSREDAVDQVRTAAARLAPLMSVTVPGATSHFDANYRTVRRGLSAGAIAVLLLIGASLLVNTLEQLRTRKRPLAVLAAFGARRRTLTLSILWQTAISLVVGLLLAIGAGILLGAALLRMAHQPMSFDWQSAAGIIGIGAAVVLLVTALSMPALWRLMRPDGLRSE